MVTQILGDGFGELTLTEPDGPGFFHVSFADDGVTIGCSTHMPARTCFSALIDLAARDRSVRASMVSHEVHLTLQQGRADRQSRITNLPNVAKGVAGFVDIFFDSYLLDFDALRADIGDWSWQWDDLSSKQWPVRRAFGGLADRSNVPALIAVMERVGDRWVQSQFSILSSRVRSFLEEHAS